MKTINKEEKRMFIFVVSSEQRRYLEWKSKVLGASMAEVVRRCVDKAIASDRDFQEELKFPEA